MKKTLFLLTLAVILNSCVSNSNFLCETSIATKLYSEKSDKSSFIEIPSGKQIIVSGKYNKYRKAKYESYTGYLYKAKFENEIEINNSNKEILIKNKPDHKHNKYSNTSTSGKTVNVKGYYRKNGTYVKPHTRSSPSRRR